MSEEAEIPQIDDLEYLKIIDFLKCEVPAMLTQVKEPLLNFKKSVYEQAFCDYIVSYTEILKQLEDAYIYSNEKEELVHLLAAELVNIADLSIQKETKRRKQNQLLMDYNMILVVYFIPALQKQNKNSGKPFAEAVLKEWKMNFPRTNLNLTTYEEILSGFKQRYCYITTAVCHSLNKSDDCEELRILRDYRDHYLLEAKDGEAVIREYYDVAPTIVKHINKQKNAEDIYHGIYDNYLSECIRLLRRGDKVRCKKVYTQMVYELEAKFF